MAQDNRVELVDPNGNKFLAATPLEINNLVFGAGYRIAQKGLTVDQALAQLVEKGPAAEQLAAQERLSSAPPAEPEPAKGSGK